jgi:hypothetical protein
MTDRPKPCPACPGSYQLPPGYVEELVSAKRSTGLDLVDDNVYNKRLEICAACESCVDGTMCMKCGCFVQFRALSALRNCPHPGGDHWEAAG